MKRGDRLESPIFVIGCPRSGTTITLELLAAHPAFAWISRAQNRRPTNPLVSLSNVLYDLPLVGARLKAAERRHRFLPMPSEPWQFWRRYVPAFRLPREEGTPPRVRDEGDTSDAEVARVRRAIAWMCRFQGKRRFLSKYTDFGRVGLVRRIFPDARFIHVVRDGRATSYSHHRKIESGEFRVWEERAWWSSAWPEEWRSTWANEHPTSLALAAYHWKYFLSEIRAGLAPLPPAQVMELRYEDLTADPLGSVARLLSFSGLEVTKRVRTYVEHRRVRNMNFKWQEQLSSEQRDLLEHILREPECQETFYP